ncbi:hypothetical protein AAE478_004032 [Parahypoxylon ruwenzoriense]
MHLKAALAILSLAALNAAENTVERDDVPRACLQACQFTIDLSARCDQETDSDSRYRTCVCGATDSQTRLTECATCVKDNGMRDPDDNDVADLMDDCDWDFNTASASYSTGTGTATATTAALTSPTVITTVITSSSGSTTFTATQTTTQAAAGLGSATPSSSTGGAPLVTPGVGVLLAGGVAMGVPAFL